MFDVNSMHYSSLDDGNLMYMSSMSRLQTLTSENGEKPVEISQILLMSTLMCLAVYVHNDHVPRLFLYTVVL